MRIDDALAERLVARWYDVAGRHSRSVRINTNKRLKTRNWKTINCGEADECQRSTIGTSSRR